MGAPRRRGGAGDRRANAPGPVQGTRSTTRPRLHWVAFWRTCPPTKSAALDAYAPDSLPKRSPPSVRGQKFLTLVFGNLTFTTQSLTWQTPRSGWQGHDRHGPNACGVQVPPPTDGVTATYQGQTRHPVPVLRDPGEQQNLLFCRLGAGRSSSASPVRRQTLSFVTVEEKGRWSSVSPVRTSLPPILLGRPAPALDIQTSSPALRRSSPHSRTTFCNWVTT